MAIPYYFKKQNYLLMKKKLIIYTLMLTVIVGVLSSCVKEDGVFEEGGSNGIIQIDLPTNDLATPGLYPLNTTAFELVEAADLPIVVEYSGTGPAPQDVSVTISLNTKAVTDYNAYLLSKTPTSTKTFEILDPSLYTLPSSMTVVIPKGERNATLHVKFKTNGFNLGKRLALGFSVTSASSGTVSGNYGTGIFYIVAKNQWDGIYKYEAVSTVIRNQAAGVEPTLSGSNVGSLDRDLATLSATTVSIVPQWQGKNGNIGGINNTYITIDPATNLVTMKSDNATLKNTAGGVNRYDPATKTFYLAFDWGVAPNTRFVVSRLKLVGPRP
jgi:hypothetical protein